jgi:hypothetical protein
VYQHYLRSRVPLWCLFFRFRGARPPLHDAQSLTSRNPMEIPTTRFTTSSPKVCPTVLLNTLLLPRRSCHLRHRSLMPLLRLGRARCLFSSVRPLGIPRTTLSLPGPWRPCPLLVAGMARRFNRPRVAANFCRNPPSPCVRFFGCRRRPTARCRSPYPSSSAPTVSTAGSAMASDFS